MISTLKTFFFNFGLEFIRDVIKDFILKRLEKVSAVQLITVIDENKNLWEMIPEETKNNIFAIKMKYAHYLDYLKEHQHIITEERIINWLRETRPDLASILINMPTGRLWLKEQKDIILKKILDENND